MKKIIFLFLLFPLILSAQSVYEPLHRDIYEFLGRLAQKGIIKFDDEIKPVPRSYIAKCLLVADSTKTLLSDTEKDELTFYQQEFGSELSRFIKEKGNNNVRTTLTGRDSYHRYRLFNYEDNLFKVNVSPVIGYERGTVDGKSYSHRWGGLYLYGSISTQIGFSFDFRDNNESGNLDLTKSFNPETGITGMFSKSESLGRISSIEYSEIRTHLTYSWDWGHISIGKEFMEWGYGESGKLVLSQKAPSFPFIKYDLSPVKWLNFNFTHAWLASDIVDSNEVYATGWEGGAKHRALYREKYFVSHTINITPLTGLSISLGESIIYSDRFEPLSPRASISISCSLYALAILKCASAEELKYKANL